MKLRVVLLVALLFLGAVAAQPGRAEPAETPVCPAAIEFGQTIQCSIAATGEMDTYTFDATTGDALAVRMAKSSGTMWPGVRVYSPTGDKLCDFYGSTLAQTYNCTLTGSGTYTLLAFDDYDGTRTGEYFLFLQRTNNPGAALPIAFGQTLGGSILLPAEADTYTFAAYAGDKVLVRMAKTSGTMWPGVRVYGPDGIKICDTNGSTTAEIASCTLTKTGQHAILAYDGNYGTATGNYNVYLQRLNSPQVTSTPTPMRIYTPTASPTASNTATATTTPTLTMTPTATRTRGPTTTPMMHVYLPLVVYQRPPRPEAPVLAAILPPGEASSYTVQWSASSSAGVYVLQRAANAGFAAPVEVYVGPATEFPAPSAGIGSFYYRVKARNASGDSDWSSVQAVEVRWEQEPNGEPVSATGPLRADQRHYGVMAGADDVNDYFYLDLAARGTVELWLTNMAEGQDYNLVLRDAGLTMRGYSGNRENADEHILVADLPAGRYYVQVYNQSGSRSSRPYYLSFGAAR